MSQASKTALIMAGGTGGHIFPGLAVAEALRARGWTVHWLGAPNSMESDKVPARGFAFEPVEFGGVRGKGIATLLRLPQRLSRAVGQAKDVMRRVNPDVVIGFGGYLTAPAGIAAKLLGKPVLLHEQNSVPGMANKLVAKVARRVFTAFPNVLGHTAKSPFTDGKVSWVGNPLREPFLRQPAPAERFAERAGPLKLLVVGGSLGAKALNDTVPKALALLDATHRPWVAHQSGEKQIEALRQAYDAAGVDAALLPFIEDTAQAYAEADIIVCRAVASTVTEIAAVGAPAVFVPFPFAVDDHQTTNARFLVEAGGGWLVPQPQLTPEWLADFLKNVTRAELLDRAQKAKKMEKLQATGAIVAVCEELVA